MRQSESPRPPPSPEEITFAVVAASVEIASEEIASVIFVRVAARSVVMVEGSAAGVLRSRRRRQYRPASSGY